MSKYQLGLCYADFGEADLAKPLFPHVVQWCGPTDKGCVKLGEKSGDTLVQMYKEMGHEYSKATSNLGTQAGGKGKRREQRGGEMSTVNFVLLTVFSVVGELDCTG